MFALICLTRLVHQLTEINIMVAPDYYTHLKDKKRWSIVFAYVAPTKAFTALVNGEDILFAHAHKFLFDSKTSNQ